MNIEEHSHTLRLLRVLGGRAISSSLYTVQYRMSRFTLSNRCRGRHTGSVEIHGAPEARHQRCRNHMEDLAALQLLDITSACVTEVVNITCEEVKTARLNLTSDWWKVLNSIFKSHARFNASVSATAQPEENHAERNSSRLHYKFVNPVSHGRKLPISGLGIVQGFEKCSM